MANSLRISSEVCRFCLTENQDVYLGDMIYKERKYWQVLTSFTNIKYSPDDSLPQSICQMCASQLSNIHIFKQRCEASNETLLANLSCDNKIEDLEEENIPELSTVIVKEEAMVITDYQDEPVKVKSEEEGSVYSLEKEDLSDDEEVEVKKKRIRVCKKNYKCTECGIMEETPNKLARHLRTHAFNNGRVYPCKYCSMTFLKMNQLGNHIRDSCKKMQKKKDSKYQEDSDEDAETEDAFSGSDGEERPDEFKCFVCSASCNTLTSVRSHLQMYHEKYGNRLLRCCGCSFIHESSNELIEHYRVSQACTDKSNSGKKNCSTSCNICNKVFSHMISLKQHTTNHLGGKYFDCDICFKRFACKGEIMDHRKVHIDVRPHVCEDCGMSFRKSSNLLQHHRIHTGEANYQCHVCLRRFKWPSELKSHMKSHTGKKKKPSVSKGRAGKRGRRAK